MSKLSRFLHSLFNYNLEDTVDKSCPRLICNHNGETNIRLHGKIKQLRKQLLPQQTVQLYTPILCKNVHFHRKEVLLHQLHPQLCHAHLCMFLSSSPTTRLILAIRASFTPVMNRVHMYDMAESGTALVAPMDQIEK